MNARARRQPAPRIAPAFDLFDAPAPAPAPALVLAPPEPEPKREPVPVPPPWAVEAATAPAELLDLRDFAVPLERVQRAELLVIRERTANGYGCIYRAFERATACFYKATLDELTWGRIDTRRPLRAFDPVHEYTAAVEWQMQCEEEARAVIRDLCLETRRRDGESVLTSGVYDGPGYILVITDPEARHRAALAARRPA